MRRAGTASGEAGFALSEMLVASAILVTVVTLAVMAFTFLLKWTNRARVQDEMDVQVQLAMERVKRDMRLSALDRMVFFPPGRGPYTAVSLPVAVDSDGDGAVERDTERNIIWDRTLIYHVWRGAPHELRVTTFSPRDNALTEIQRLAQLVHVVVTGAGVGTYNAANASTEVLFSNLFTWRIIPRGAVYDGYSSVFGLDEEVKLGFFRLTPGPHTFTFKVLGKHASSAGYFIGLDTLVMSPSYAAREAEAQLPETAHDGPAPTRAYVPGGSFSGHHQLTAALTGPGESFTLTLYNDQWEETNFDHEFAEQTNMIVEFDETLNPKDYVLRLEGNGTTWSAGDVTADRVGAAAPRDIINGCAVRVLLRGSEMLNGMHLERSGGKVSVNFRASDQPGEKLQIDHAFIMEHVDHVEPTPDGEDAVRERLTFGGQAGQLINTGADVWSDWIAYPIDPLKSYLVTFLVNKKKEGGASRGTPWHWTEPVAPSNGSCWVWMAFDTPEEGEVKKEVWSDKLNDKVFRTNSIFAVEAVSVAYVPSGRFQSQVFDTRMDRPVYEWLNWNADVPAGCTVRIKVRSDDSPVMTNAPAWAGVTAMTVPGAINPGDRRYVQFMAELLSNSALTATPRLKNVAVRWRGKNEVVDLGGTFVKSPSNGVFELLADNTPLLTALTVDLKIFRKARGTGGEEEITSALSAEAKPLNTRK